jgi:hypothetical protein
MTFHFEAEMQAPVRQWLKAQGLITRAEFATPWGICDLVGVSFNSSSVEKRLGHGQTQTIGPASRVAILHEIPDEEDHAAITFRRLSKLFEHIVEPEFLRHQINYLTKAKFVASPKLNCYKRINGWLPLHDRIVAIELKLSRLSEAINQASAHRTFASEAYVALPRATALRVIGDRRVHQLSAAGVGLLSVERQSCEVIASPPRSASLADPVLQLAFVERFWISHLKDRTSLVAAQFGRLS